MKRLIQNLSSRKKVSNTLSEYQEGLVIIDDKIRKQLQETLLEMYIDVLTVCERHNIVPYLIGGSCLGAIRHKGFIPWDDDLDIGMLRKDYLAFRDIFEKELGEMYVMSAPNYSDKSKNRFPKVMKKGTIYREVGDNSEPDKCGIPLDIFILENIPFNESARKLKGIYCNLLEFIGGQVSLRENMDPLLEKSLKAEGNIEYFIRSGVGVVGGLVPSYRWFNNIDKAVQHKRETGYIGIPTGRKHYFGEIFTVNCILPPRYVEFCGIKAPVFNEAERYLLNLYGEDYMELPPENKREKHLIRELKF